VLKVDVIFFSYIKRTEISVSALKTNERDRLLIDPAYLPSFGWRVMLSAATCQWLHNKVQKLNFKVLFITHMPIQIVKFREYLKI
jgi:hypothetical protein